MTRVVPDTNVLVSGLFWSGPPRRILELARAGRIEMVWCAAAEREIARVLAHRKLGLEPSEIVRIIRSLRAMLATVEPTVSCDRVREDPADNVFLACAVTVRANAIVSGDRHLVSLGEHDGIPILRPADYLAKLGGSAR